MSKQPGFTQPIWFLRWTSTHLIILGQGHGSLPLSQSQQNPNHENVSEDVHLLPCPFLQKESQENPILAVDKQAST